MYSMYVERTLHPRHYLDQPRQRRLWNQIRASPHCTFIHRQIFWILPCVQCWTCHIFIFAWPNLSTWSFSTRDSWPQSTLLSVVRARLLVRLYRWMICSNEQSQFVDNSYSCATSLLSVLIKRYVCFLDAQFPRIFKFKNSFAALLAKHCFLFYLFFWMSMRM